ncbi:MAG: amylo-alpha-1,6-glucosidase [Candidatus Micrarchaeota archaeon]
MNPKNIFTDVPPEENYDWGHGRTRRALLRSSDSEFSQSVFTATMDGFSIPNRDYPYEGLFAIIEGENWKFLDGAQFSLLHGGKRIDLKAASVRIFPWKAEYSYSITSQIASGKLHVEYFLLRGSRHPTLRITFRLEKFPHDDTEIRLRPLVDIRHMCSQSSPFEHSAREVPGGILVERGEKRLYLMGKSFAGFENSQSTQSWHYKLGSGNRELRDGAVRFVPDERSLFVPGEMRLAFQKSATSLQAICTSGQKSKPSLELAVHNERKIIAKLMRVQKEFAARLSRANHHFGESSLALHGRLFNLLESFEIVSEGIRAPDAGAFWFRNAWFRDALFGIGENFEIVFKSRKAYLKALLLKTLSMQEEGLIPNKLPERRENGRDYASVDATLLCFICCLKYLERSDDRTLQRAFKEGVKRFLQSLTTGPVMLENYLLRTPAHYSWMDSKLPYDHFGQSILVSSRIPNEWASRIAKECKTGDEFAKRMAAPDYYLAEINALWIRFLTDFNALYPSKEFETLQKAASLNFKSFFFPGDFHDVVGPELRKTEILSSASLYSASLLPELFSDDEIAKIVMAFETSFVYKNRLLFGILARNVSDRVFYGDAQYHGAVIWPRESIPLYRLLRRMNDPRAKEILISNLDHQMAEGAVFFNHELFSLPEGQNPYPSAESYSPVPVKNPAQFWSQWVEPYFEFIEKH